MNEFFIKLINIHFFVPWLTVGRIVSLLLVLLIIVLIIKVWNGTSTISLWGLKIQNDKRVEVVQKEFEALNENNNLKTHYLKLLNQAVLTTEKCIPETASRGDLLHKINDFYDFYLHGIITILTNKDNVHRVAVFHKHNESELKILYGHGYSPEGKEHLRLGLYDSKAGYSFIQQEVFHSGDLTQDSSYVRNPKSSKQYHSLLCVPIIYENESIGVLSIDGLNVNSFHKDDIDYITYMANGISIILHKELNMEWSKEEVLS